MANTQQEVIFYNEGIGGTAQRRFEKDLRKRQKEGWRVVSVTPTKQTFHHIFQLTVIYEKDDLDKSVTTVDNHQTVAKLPDISNEPTVPAKNKALLLDQPEQELLLENTHPENIHEEELEDVHPENFYEKELEDARPSNPYEQITNNIYPSNPYEQVAPYGPYRSNSVVTEQAAPQLFIPYSKTIFLCLIIASIIAFVFAGNQNEYVASIGISLFMGIFVCLLIVDIKGFFSLDGLIKWRQMKKSSRTGIGCLFLFFFPIFFFIYLIRLGKRVFSTDEPVFAKSWNAPQPVKNRSQVGLIVGSVIALVFMLSSLFSASALATAQPINASVSGNTESSQPTPMPKPSLTAKPSPTPKPSPIAKPSPTPKPSPVAKPSPTTVPKPSPTVVTYAQFDDGTYVVGQDIQPGTYRTQGASMNCYYARLSGFGGTLDDIIANNNTDDPAIVTISDTDKGFESTNCGTWTKDLSAITTSNTSFGDGMYIVGTDIQPGTYKNGGQSGCYYARLSGFGNTTDDIIANDNSDTPVVVTISADDKGFQSNRCGTWVRV